MDPPIKLVVLAGAERVPLFVKECYTGSVMPPCRPGIS